MNLYLGRYAKAKEQLDYLPTYQYICGDSKFIKPCSDKSQSDSKMLPSGQGIAAKDWKFF